MNVFINGENVTVAGDPCRALLDGAIAESW